MELKDVHEKYDFVLIYKQSRNKYDFIKYKKKENKVVLWKVWKWFFFVSFFVNRHYISSFPFFKDFFLFNNINNTNNIINWLRRFKIYPDTPSGPIAFLSTNSFIIPFISSLSILFYDILFFIFYPCGFFFLWQILL